MVFIKNDPKLLTGIGAQCSPVKKECPNANIPPNSILIPLAKTGE